MKMVWGCKYGALTWWVVRNLLCHEWHTVPATEWHWPFWHRLLSKNHTCLFEKSQYFKCYTVFTRWWEVAQQVITGEPVNVAMVIWQDIALIWIDDAEKSWFPNYYGQCVTMAIYLKTTTVIKMDMGSCFITLLQMQFVFLQQYSQMSRKFNVWQSVSAK